MAYEQTLAVPRRVFAHVRFNYEGDTQRTLWQRMWLFEQERGCYIASLANIAAGFIAAPLAEQLLGPAKWYSPWVAIGILLMCFFHSVVMYRHSLHYRRLRQVAEGEDSVLWQKIDAALADVQKSVGKDEPTVNISLTVPS